MPSSGTKTAKLRASCDGCNESKVRCSQTKPQCARCIKQGITCVYGLSRRSHKTAPRVGASSQTASSLSNYLHPDDVNSMFPTRESSETLNNVGSDSGSALTESEAAAGMRIRGISGTNPSGATAEEDAMEFEIDGDFLDSTHPMADFSADYGSLDLTMGGSLPDYDALNDLSMAAFFGSSEPARDDTHGSPTDGPPCNCNSLAVQQLLSFPVLPQEENGGSLDTYFARLKHAINTSEECISCACTARDEMSISM
ncbi:hypothetical protein VPNG_08534 [Cytospora leucostoma]|uniref:Zn(2)-C6 fungal-type domain-containing protein n=1 Tax=Cytospora leucostoma TaxID=1230097 RepID=A0A423W585_9PEZI|nr:hypothetical protein VPNG_08534 [Cytospora leucostoma]